MLSNCNSCTHLPQSSMAITSSSQLQAQNNVQVLAYLNAFAEEYDLKRHISFNTSVMGMQPVSSTQPGDYFALTS